MAWRAANPATALVSSILVSSPACITNYTASRRGKKVRICAFRSCSRRTKLEQRCSLPQRNQLVEL
jgi:hypothetical protein